MKLSLRTLLIAALVALILGFLLGFIPEHTRSTRQRQQIAELTSASQTAQAQFDTQHNNLLLSGFAIQAGKAYMDAENNNFSVASVDASALFTALRSYTDQTQDQQVRQHFGEILDNRDRAIAALAKADPAVKPLLQNIFLKLQGIEAQARQAKA
jgi:hypothetical protein